MIELDLPGHYAIQDGWQLLHLEAVERGHLWWRRTTLMWVTIGVSLSPDPDKRIQSLVQCAHDHHNTHPQLEGADMTPIRPGGETPNEHKNYGYHDRTVSLGQETWPANTEPDGIMWGLGWCRRERAIMADNDTASDTPAGSIEDGMTFVPSGNPKDVAPTNSMLNLLAEHTGTYAEMAAVAVKLNVAQNQIDKSFTYYPRELIKESV